MEPNQPDPLHRERLLNVAAEVKHPTDHSEGDPKPQGVAATPAESPEDIAEASRSAEITEGAGEHPTSAEDAAAKDDPGLVARMTARGSQSGF